MKGGLSLKALIGKGFSTASCSYSLVKPLMAALSLAKKTPSRIPAATKLGFWRKGLEKTLFRKIEGKPKKAIVWYPLDPIPCVSILGEFRNLFLWPSLDHQVEEIGGRIRYPLGASGMRQYCGQ